MKNKWFAVKTLYSITLEKTKSPSMLEERIVIFKAKDIDAAIAKAKEDAKKYSSYEYKNLAEQSVKTEFLKCFDAYEISDEFKSGAEVFSSNEVIVGKFDRSKIIDNRFGKRHGRKEKSLRKNFFSQ